MEIKTKYLKMLGLVWLSLWAYGSMVMWDDIDITWEEVWWWEVLTGNVWDYEVTIEWSEWWVLEITEEETQEVGEWVWSLSLFAKSDDWKNLTSFELDGTEVWEWYEYWEDNEVNLYIPGNASEEKKNSLWVEYQEWTDDLPYPRWNFTIDEEGYKIWVNFVDEEEEVEVEEEVDGSEEAEIGCEVESIQMEELIQDDVDVDASVFEEEELERLHCEYEYYEWYVSHQCSDSVEDIEEEELLEEIELVEWESIEDRYDILSVTVNGESSSVTCNTYNLIIEKEIVWEAEVEVNGEPAEDGEEFEFSEWEEVELEVSNVGEWNEFVSWYGDHVSESKETELEMNQWKVVWAEVVEEWAEEAEYDIWIELEWEKKWEEDSWNKLYTKLEWKWEVVMTWWEEVIEYSEEDVHYENFWDWEIEVEMEAKELSTFWTWENAMEFVWWTGAVETEDNKTSVEFGTGAEEKVVVAYFEEEDVDEEEIEYPGVPDLWEFEEEEDPVSEGVVHKIEEVVKWWTWDISKIEEAESMEELREEWLIWEDEYTWLEDILEWEELSLEIERTNSPELENEIEGTWYDVEVNSYEKNPCGYYVEDYEFSWGDCEVEWDWSREWEIVCEQEFEVDDDVYVRGWTQWIEETIVYDEEWDVLSSDSEEWECSFESEDAVTSHDNLEWEEFTAAEKEISIDWVVENECYTNDTVNPFYPGEEEQWECGLTLDVELEEELHGSGTKVVWQGQENISRVSGESEEIEEILTEEEYEEYKEALDDLNYTIEPEGDVEDWVILCENIEEEMEEDRNLQRVLTSLEELDQDAEVIEAVDVNCNSETNLITIEEIEWWQTSYIWEQIEDYARKIELRYDGEYAVDYAWVEETSIDWDDGEWEININWIRWWVPYHSEEEDVIELYFEREDSDEDRLVQVDVEDVSYAFGDVEVEEDDESEEENNEEEWFGWNYGSEVIHENVWEDEYSKEDVENAAEEVYYEDFEWEDLEDLKDPEGEYYQDYVWTIGQKLSEEVESEDKDESNDKEEWDSDVTSEVDNEDDSDVDTSVWDDEDNDNDEGENENEKVADLSVSPVEISVWEENEIEVDANIKWYTSCELQAWFFDLKTLSDDEEWDDWIYVGGQEITVEDEKTIKLSCTDKDTPTHEDLELKDEVEIVGEE